jgi:hypothetical protein
MTPQELTSITSLLSISAKALEKSDDYRHKELARLMRNKVKQLNKKYNGQK